jgi:CHAT domain-containing protein/tetratricopeptide (TPR) repeat protein
LSRASRLAALVSLWLIGPGHAEVPEPLRLAPGAPVERTLSGKERHAYVLAGTGKPLLVTVEQRGIDVVLSAPGKSPVEVNTDGSRWGTESLLMPAGTEALRIEVSPAVPEAPAGRYEVRVEPLADATAGDRDRIEAERLFTEAGALQRRGTAEGLRGAAERAGQALEIWRRLGGAREQARTLYFLATLDYQLGRSAEAEASSRQSLSLWDELHDPLDKGDALALIGLAEWAQGDDAGALERSQEAREIFHGQGERWGEAVTLNNVCLIRHSRGEWLAAVPCYEEALRLLRETGDPAAETSALINLGGVYDLLGEPQRALDAYGQTLARARGAGDRAREAQSQNNLAVVYMGLGETREALARYEQALSLFRALGDRRGEARALNNLGVACRRTGEPQRSAGFLEEALALRREISDRRGEAATLNNLGRAREDLGDVPKALDLYRQSLTAGRSVADRRGEAVSLHLIGAAEGRLGNAPEALARLAEALEARRALGDRPGQAETLTALAQVERGLGRLDPARAHAGEALDLIESQRVRVTDPDLRATYLATQQRAFDLAIGLERRAEASLVLAERARARSLLELLQEARAEVRRGIDPALRARELEVADRLSAAVARQLELPGGAPSKERKAAVERGVRDLLAESEKVAEEVRRTSPRYAALTQPRPLDAAGIRGLLGPDTLLLEYRLGEDKSFLWAVTAGAVERHELPRREVIETLARRVYGELSTAAAGARTGKGAARELSRRVLGPVAGRLAGRRLAIVADGALQYIPFAALPEPGHPERFLIESHEVVSLPSASVLAVDRAVPVGRRPAAGLAVLADPVFSAGDPRVQASRRGPSGLSRLPETRREAEAITALLPPAEVKILLGFDARRGTVVGGDLDRYRIVHFATHGVIDAETPRLSGLVLSLVDRQGKPQEGFLSLADVYNLDLAADLVVLSGCETALGREIRGEGLIGLVRGFLYAGSRSVAASLWRVQDRATAELMARFYRTLLQQRKPPAAALREAQLSILREHRWHQPYSWAGFVVQGDWR